MVPTPDSDPTASAAQDCAAQLRVLADSTRLAVVRTLLDGPRRVGEINAELGLDQSLLSHHLRTLRDAGLVESERAGKGVLYRLAPGVGVEAVGVRLGCCTLRFDEAGESPGGAE